MNKQIQNAEIASIGQKTGREMPSAAWVSSVKEVLNDVFAELLGTGEYKRANKSLYKFLLELPEDTDIEVAKRTAKIYKFFREATLERPQKDNYENNRMLAERSFEATLTGEVSLWRFVCMPELAMKIYNAQLEGFELVTSMEPCMMCLGKAYWAGIRKITYVLAKEDVNQDLAYETNIPTAQIQENLNDGMELIQDRSLHTEALEICKLWESAQVD